MDLKRLGKTFAAFLLFCACASPVTAQVPPHGDTIVETRHRMQLNGKPLAYTARAGLLPLLVNDTGERMGSIFFIAYSVEQPAGAPPRPITFLWNGGPGSNSAQVHVVGFGPKRVTTADTYPEWGSHTETPLIDNQETWLETSDLVFIDPPGTGFSRAISVEARDVLYTTHGDAEAVAEAIRVYLTRYDGWGQPLYVGGESYGTTRAMWVAHALERRRSTVDGVILISGGLDLGGEVPRSLRDALLVPQLTTVAHYHGRLPADLQQMQAADAMAEADGWARSVYAPALEDPDALDADEREAVRSGLARYTGIEAGRLPPTG